QPAQGDSPLADGVSVARLELPAGTFVVTFVGYFIDFASYVAADNSRRVACSAQPPIGRLFTRPRAPLDGPELFLDGESARGWGYTTASWTTTATGPNRFEMLCGEITHPPDDPTDVKLIEARITAIQVSPLTRYRYNPNTGVTTEVIP